MKRRQRFVQGCGVTHVTEGQRWTFVPDAMHGKGGRREYVVEHVEQMSDRVQPMAALVRLRNLAGGGVAEVTVKWLLEPPSPRGHWVREDVAA